MRTGFAGSVRIGRRLFATRLPVPLRADADRIADVQRLEFGELLPSKPGWLEQEDYEERNRIGFMLDRTTKAVNGLAAMADRQLWSSDAQQAPGIIEETDEFRTTRVDTGDGPEVITIERK